MARLSASIIALALGLAAAMALVSCGSSGSAELLPGSTARQINSNLSQVEQLAGEGECVGAEDAAAAVSGQIESLNGVDARLKQALSEGATRLNEVVAACEETTEETTEPVEPLEEAESEEEEEKAKGEKAEKGEKEAEKEKKEEEPEETEESTEGPTLPPQSNGKGEEKGGGPPVEPPSQSGGVGPGAPVEED
jgi:hypothetical protein